MRRGMTIIARRKLREEILEKETARAYERAQEAGRTLRCRDAMRAMASDPALARSQHSMCQGEEVMGSGCLCECHDVITGNVVAGQMQELDRSDTY